MAGHTLAQVVVPPADDHAEALVADEECAFADGPDCALSALQRTGDLLRASLRRGASDEAVGCHTAKPGEACYGQILWARHEGMKLHPKWYGDLTPDSSVEHIQQFIHAKNGGKCPRPCTSQPPLWCAGQGAPQLWAPASGGAPTTIKALSYNLFWWYLFRKQKGNGHSAGKLILANMEPAFDVMGFQECEDIKQVLGPVGLLEKFEVFGGPHAICMAYNKGVWSLISKGIGDVAEDMSTKYYGRRGTQWMRLQHLQTGLKLFFINHHGPLSINSGGSCGGEATSHNLLQMMAKNAKKGDTLVLVGDFNANAGSRTIQNLWSNLVHVFVGPSWGGVDNIFSNADTDAIESTKVLGSGGSDHNAIAATLRIGGGGGNTLHTSAPVEAAKEMTGAAKPGYEWQDFWCGLIEVNTEYVMDTSVFFKSIVHGMADPERCCRECQADSHCRAWLWKDFSETINAPECILSGAAPKSKSTVDGFSSGLPFGAAAWEASKAAKNAISRM